MASNQPQNRKTNISRTLANATAKRSTSGMKGNDCSFRSNKLQKDENVSESTSKGTTGKIQSGNKMKGNCKRFLNTFKKLTKSEGGINSTNALIKLFEESEIEILFTLLRDSTFVELLSKDKYEPELMTAILNVFGKASEASQLSNVSKLIHEILSNHHFITQVQLYILHCHKTVTHEIDLSALENFLKLLNKFQSFEPSNSVDTVVAILPLLECTCAILTSKGANMQEFNKLLSDIKEQKDNVIDLFSKSKSEDPPDNFRNLSIIPTVDDIKEVNAFIRPNIVEGKYANTEHYLDVQFRLLREDYMRPLRLGIQQYLYLSAAEQLNSKNLKKIQNIKFYQDFKVLYPIVDETGVFYLASFDLSLLSHVNWECTKRFMSGSLICFSNNNFDSAFFASVVDREIKLLKQGLLVIKLEESSCENLMHGLSMAYVMVETEAYFEAFRYNLTALKQMNSDNMPLQDYIVHVKKEIKHPSYLHSFIRYNMFSKNVPVLKFDKWPAKEEFGFDETQYEAFKAAITKEFSIIQGPPGTGKTFIALKITEMLLQNKKCLSNPSPILVVCYTNHALDQFLEGILSYTKKIGRVGGRCENPKIQPYLLKHLRSKEKTVFTKRRSVSENARLMIRKIHAELCEYIERMDAYTDKFDACVSNILCDKLLFNIMSQDHYYSLISVINNAQSYDGNLIKDWLGLRSNEISELSLLQNEAFYALQNEQNVLFNQQKNISERSETDTEIDVIQNEIDVDSEVNFIEGLRMIDDDDVGIRLKALLFEDEEKIHETEGDWSMYSRKNNKFIRHRLKSTKAMLHSEVYKVADVWQLPLEKRWSLYVYWVENFMNRLNQDIVHHKEHILRLREQLQEIRNLEDVYILKKCNIIGMTTTGAAKFKNIVEKLKPQIIIFEEAAEVLETHVVTSLTEDTKHVILIGDHQQLRPNPTVYELAKKYNFDVSLFERMVKNGLECHKLTFQHRMRPLIANLLVPHIYPDLKNHQSVFSYPDIKGVDKNMFFINHNAFETEDVEMKSHVNEHEAKFILALATYLIMQGYNSTQITILTTYSGQLFLLKKLAKNNKLLAEVRITIVDNYQGEENVIILISYVRSNKHGGVGFLRISNRVCVSLSRAKQGLYCIGNFELLGKRCALWKEIQSKLMISENIGNALKLNCQLHPETSVLVSTAEDFKNFPEGGCLKPCGKSLSCGHVCAKKCHPTDLEHLEYSCMRPCPKKLCENGHDCPALCYQKCGKCKILMTRVMPFCGHENKMACHFDPHKWSCNTVCAKALSCGHTCLYTCGRCRSKGFCSDCIVKVTTFASCGHSVITFCYKKSNMAAVQEACSNPCKATLNCGHICKGSCKTCTKFSVGKKLIVHVSCKMKCTRLISCGHKCKQLCGDECSTVCHELVDKEYPCGHKAKVKCSEFSTAKCSSSCLAILLCGHICSGNCTRCRKGVDHIPCKKLVTRTLVCGHTMKLSCSSPEHPLCKKLCAKDLSCGHKCPRNCSDPCEVQCNAVAVLRKPCGHVEPSLCHERYEKCEACIIKLGKLLNLGNKNESDRDDYDNNQDESNGDDYDNNQDEFDRDDSDNNQNESHKNQGDSDSDDYSSDGVTPCSDLDFCYPSD